jgi:VanZ family protein
MTGLQRAWIAFGLPFVALVIYLSLTADPFPIDLQMPFKAGHVTAYAWLMLWFSQVVRSVRSRGLLALALLGLGVALEFAQGMTGYRTFSYSDMLDDGIGVAVGWALAVTPIGNFVHAIEQRRAIS